MKGAFVRGTVLPVLLVVGLAGCAGSAPAPIGPRLSPDQVRYLESPLTGYPRAVDVATRRQLEQAHQDLLASGSSAAAQATAEAVLAQQPDLEPASVLLAQAAFLEESYERVIELLTPITRRLAQYEAAQRLLGRAAELSGEIPAAYDAFVAVAATDAVAAEGAQRTRERAMEIIDHRLHESLRAGRVGEAAAALRRLQEIDPESEVGWRAAMEVALATDDRQSELTAVRHLAGRYPEDDELRLRRGVLESEIGDSGTGLRILQELATMEPGNEAVIDALARARFRWRLDLLPEEVQTIAAREEISRADFTSLLFWLFPSVRYGAAGDARIATDILDHPRRVEIIRVVNQGLMEIDPGVHEFAPDRRLVRSETLTALLRLLAANDPPASCLGGRSLGTSPGPEIVCRAAAACGLIDADADCLPDAAATGPWVVERCRKALQQLGI